MYLTRQWLLWYVRAGRVRKVRKLRHTFVLARHWDTWESAMSDARHRRARAHDLKVRHIKLVCVSSEDTAQGSLHMCVHICACVTGSSIPPLARVEPFERASSTQQVLRRKASATAVAEEQHGRLDVCVQAV
jgi:hypothetical protein